MSTPRTHDLRSSSTPVTTAVIVHYGDPTPTVDVVRMLETCADHVVVVANDLSSRPPQLPERAGWLVPERNLGYGEAFMRAASKSPGDVLVLLNTDIVLPETTFRRCVDALFDADDIGISGPVLRHDDGTLQSGAATFTRWRRAPLVMIDPGSRTVDCEWVTGAVMFVRREVVDRIGMDGSYFLGAEDADLCVRASGEGWRTVCCGDAGAIHHGSVDISGPRWYYYSVRNRFWFVREHFGRAPAVLGWLRAAVALPRVATADLVKRRGWLATRLHLLGLVHAWWAKPPMSAGPLPDEPLPSRVMRW